MSSGKSLGEEVQNAVLNKPAESYKNMVVSHPRIWFAVTLILVIGTILLVVGYFPGYKIEPKKGITGFNSGNVLVTSPASALDRTLGSCLSEPGRDGSCGAASAFSSKPHQHFLGSRGAGPDFTATAALDSEYWNSELSSSGDEESSQMAAAQGAQMAVQAVQNGSIPPMAAPAVASTFAAQRARHSNFSADDQLLRLQSAVTSSS